MQTVEIFAAVGDHHVDGRAAVAGDAGPPIVVEQLNLTVDIDRIARDRAAGVGHEREPAVRRQGGPAGGGLASRQRRADRRQRAVAINIITTASRWRSAHPRRLP